MKTKSLLLPVLALASMSALVSCTGNKPVAEEPALKSVFPDYTVGVALNVRQAAGQDKLADSLVTRHFNSIVPENCMKHEEIHPAKDTYNFEDADQFVQYGVDRGMQIIGHCLVWHSQCAPWFGVDKDEKPVSAEVLKQRLKDHITTIVSRYRNRVDGWDVVNEMVEDDGSYRNSFFYQILGAEYIPLAFQYAHEADPNAELYLNDYAMASPGRRERYVEIIKRLQSKGIKIDGMGLQGHWGLEYPTLDEIQTSIDMFAELGIKVSITELDMSILPRRQQGITAAVDLNFQYEQSLDPYKGNFPQEPLHDWNYRMQQFFELFKKNADKLERVTVWGVCDQDSWLNNWPIVGRYDYATLITRNHRIKPVDFWIMKNY